MCPCSFFSFETLLFCVIPYALFPSLLGVWFANVIAQIGMCVGGGIHIHLSYNNFGQLCRVCTLCTSLSLLWLDAKKLERQELAFIKRKTVIQHELRSTPIIFIDFGLGGHSLTSTCRVIVHWGLKAFYATIVGEFLFILWQGADDEVHRGVLN